MKQHGATLIIILIIILAIMSITAIAFQMSLLEFKNTIQQQSTTVDFYRAENCLHQAMQKIYAAKAPLQINNDSILDFSKISVAWWNTHGYFCAKNLWRYTQILSAKTSDGYIFYRITVYFYPHLLLQTTVGKSFTTAAPIISSWRQENL